MTRLEVLEREKEIVKGLKCLPFGLKDEVMENYQREITAIVKYGAPNPEYEERGDK